MRSLWSALPALTAAFLGLGSSAFALEDHVVMNGRFDWIVPDDVDDAFPNGELNSVRTHLVRFEATRESDGLFRVELTLPTNLTAGKRVVAKYKQVPTPDGDDLEFVNQKPGLSGDYLVCSEGTDSWVDVFCGDVKGLKQARDVPVAERKAYASDRFGGTSMGKGMIAFASAEPGGTLEFSNTTEQGVGPWVGRWSTEYRTALGQIVRAVVEIDGFTGIYRPVGSTARGVFRRFSVDDDGHLHGTWEMNGSTGWLRFEAAPGGAFQGEWGTDDSDAAVGSWVGRRLL
jgi:hypothetical protein